MRWLHIYLSMFGLAAVLFFSVTGITLNHPNAASPMLVAGERDDRRLGVSFRRLALVCA